jgi:hypothetical protein
MKDLQPRQVLSMLMKRFPDEPCQVYCNWDNFGRGKFESKRCGIYVAKYGHSVQFPTYREAYKNFFTKFNLEKYSRSYIF